MVSYEVTTRAERFHGNGHAEGAGRHPFRDRERQRSGECARLCLRQCLSTLYPAIADVRLTDYKVRVLDFKKGTAARVRVLTEWSDHRRSWATVGVSENVIEASWFALVDALRLELMRLSEQDPKSTGGRRLLLGTI